MTIKPGVTATTAERVYETYRPPAISNAAMLNAMVVAFSGFNLAHASTPSRGNRTRPRLFARRTGLVASPSDLPFQCASRFAGAEYTAELGVEALPEGEASARDAN